MLPVAFTAALADLLGTRLRRDEPLARHTSFRIGGPADVMALPDTPQELASLVRQARAAGVPVAVLGGGSNLLVGDGGWRGVVVKLGRGFRTIRWRGTEVVVGAG